MRPIRIPCSTRPEGVWVKCKTCPWCKGNRVNDWAGRCVAEQQFSTAVVSLTLTYAKLGAGASIDERYGDVQLMLKRLRKDRYKVRYVFAGEYGEKKGRMHWHGILFFRGPIPDFELNTNFFNWKYWPHGYTYVQSPDFEGMTYVLKYTLKDDDPRAREAKRLHMSKYPPIGAEYFQSLAQDYVNAGLPVHSPEYSFAHLRLRSGKLRKFWLADRSRELFLDGYVRKWREAYGTEPPQTEFLTQEFYDPAARAEADAEANRAFAERQRDAEQTGFLLLPHPVLGVVSRYSDGTAVYVPHGLGKGEQPWHLDIGDGSASAVRIVGGRLRRAGLRSDLIASVLRWLTLPPDPIAP